MDREEKLSEEFPVAADFFLPFITGPMADIVNNTVPTKPAQGSLLYELLRIASLTEYARQGDIILRKLRVAAAGLCVLVQ